MSTVQFLAEWAVRSSILILTGALLLLVLRVKSATTRWAAWVAMLCGSLAIPLLTPALPDMPFAIPRSAPAAIEAPAVALDAAPIVAPAPAPLPAPRRPFDWARAAELAYAVVALALLLRLSIGLAISSRLLRESRPTGEFAGVVEIRETDRVASPVTLGIVKPAIVLPADWRDWDSRKLEAVLAHERSHAVRYDTALQMLSAIHRALLWHSPLSWVLHRRLVRVAEEASDDAAVAATLDRAFYAQVLLDFIQRGVGDPGLAGVSMARYGRPDKRIDRILDGAFLSRGVTRWAIAAIIAIGTPLVYVVAAAHAQNAPPAPVPAPASRPARQVQAPPTPASRPQPGAAYIAGLGAVAPAASVTVRPRIDGELMSIDFKEGETVKVGQLLATLDPRPYQPAIADAEMQVAADAKTLQNARIDLERYRKLVGQAMVGEDQVSAATVKVAQFESKLQTDEAAVDRAKLLVSYAKITAPIAGVAGLRMIDPGNVVHDGTGIVVINQVQPIAVLFSIPEDSLPRVLAGLNAGASPTVEAWNRANTARLAIGRLTAVDNQIDPATGMVKLKAIFENKEGALIPGQTVNVRLFAR